MEMDIDKADYYYIRNFLLTKNYTFRKFLGKVKETKGYEQRDELIYYLGIKFSLSEQFISDYLKDFNIPLNQLFHHPNLKIVRNLNNIQLRLPEEGFYIKVESDTTKDEVLRLYKLIRFLWKDMVKHGLFKNKRKLRKNKGAVEKYLYIYEMVEKVIEEIVEYNLKEKTKNPYKLNKTEIFSAVVDDLIKNDEDDKEIERLNKDVRQIYYRLVERYNLPDPKALEDLPQVNNPSKLINVMEPHFVSSN